MSLKSYIHSPKSGQKPKSMVILLHGLGSNGADLIDLAQYWDSALPDTVFISPDAPFPCDMAPYGHQWFSLQDRSPSAMLEGVREAAPILNHYIDATLEEYGIRDEKLALVGFSQGTMMSLYTGPRRAKRIAGVLGYSGALIGAEELTAPAIHKIPVNLVHGDADGVVPPMAYHIAKTGLELAGFTVSGGMTKGLVHSIDADGIKTGGNFLAKCLL